MSGYRSDIQLGRFLGAGHFGRVYEAQDPVHGLVAVKKMERPPTFTCAEWDDERRRLLHEARMLQQARHPNVVRVFHLVEDADSILFAMEHCARGALQSVFETGPAGLNAVRQVAIEVGLGLCSLHAKNMLHRDIKPGNILVADDGTHKLADFGLVTDHLVLGYASNAGYSDHVAHEVWHGQGTSQKSDVWALGMTLYRLLHGAQWYSESVRPRHVIANGGFAAGLTWLPHIPPEWRRLLRHMMHDDPGKRCASAQRALDHFGQLPVTPDWSCAVAPAKVEWSAAIGKRRVHVEWDRRNARQHEWRAWSEPVGAGKRHTLAGSGGVVPAAQAIRQLSQFFKSRS